MDEGSGSGAIAMKAEVQGQGRGSRRAHEAHRRDGLLALSIVVLVLVSYAPALRAGFIWDDDAYVTENRTLRSADGLRRIWLEVGATPQYYPAVHTSFWLEYALWELEPLGYHLDNVLLHALAALLLWRLLRRLEVPGAWLAAAVFALHPVHVESVAWVTERKNVLSGVFYLASLIALSRFDPPDPRVHSTPRSRFAYGWASFFFIAALLSKTVTASLPAVWLLILWWKRGRLGLRDVVPVVPFFVVGAGFGLVTVWMETAHVGAQGSEWSLSPIERGLVAGRALWFYLAKLGWPMDLAFIYPRWRIDDGEALQYVFPVAFAGLLVAFFLLRARIGRGPFVALACFAGTLFPALGFLDVFPHRFSYVADHFQYLASIGILVPVVATLASFRDRMPARVSTLAAIGLLAILGALTWRQCRIYFDAETLWLDTLAKNPDAYIAHTQLGHIEGARGEARSALAHYREALRIKPEDALALNNLAWFLATTSESTYRNPARAVELAERAARATNQRAPGVLDTLAAAYAADGRFGDAVATVDRAIALARLANASETVEVLELRRRSYRAGEAVIDMPGGVE